MIRKVQKTFDWEYLVRWLTAASVLYVLASAAVHGALAPLAAAGPALGN